jgi:hypothetical protein
MLAANLNETGLQNLGGKFLHKNATCPDKPETVAKKNIIISSSFWHRDCCLQKAEEN